MFAAVVRHRGGMAGKAYPCAIHPILMKMTPNQKAKELYFHQQAQKRADAEGILEEIDGLVIEDIRRLYYDLRVNKIALEMRNEMLSRERREAEDAWQRYMNLYDFSPVGYISLDKSGNIHSANLTAASVLEIEREELIGCHFSQFVSPDHKDRFERNRQAMINIRERRSCSLNLVKPDKTQFHARLELIIVENDAENDPEIRFSVTDISEQKKAESELEASREKLRRLSRHLQSLRERERYTVSRAIHDELSQVLAVLKMDLSSLGDSFIPGDITAVEKLENIRTLVDRTIKVTKYLVNDLRPYLLDELGLKSAVHWAAREFSNRSGIEIETIIEPAELSVDEPRAISVFRILQELLTNVERHSNAAAVTIQLNQSDDVLLLDVCDNGRGISSTQMNETAFGLMGIQERAYEFGGEIKIDDLSPRGTRVRVRIPLGPAVLRSTAP